MKLIFLEKRSLKATSILLIAFLYSCGGGGGDAPSDNPVNINPQNSDNSSNNTSDDIAQAFSTAEITENSFGNCTFGDCRFE